MGNQIMGVRNKILHFLYIKALRPLFFLFDPERTHDFITAIGRLLGHFFFTRTITSLAFSYTNPVLEQNILGIHFANPVGLAAGFDKDALLTDILPDVGFGFAEVGSITGEPCEGNEKPRLWRLKRARSLVVNYGLQNSGSEKIAARICHKNFKIPIGISIAKTNNQTTADIEAGINDYLKAFHQFINIGQYITINISCPNAYGGEPFTNPEPLDRLLAAIDAIPAPKPIFLKLSPDLNGAEVDNILRVCDNHRIHGFICSNLTKSKNNPKLCGETVPASGGISGKAVEDLANNQIRYIYRKTGEKYVIIGCGGIFSAEDAYVKIKAGASLVQLITGMIFEGPQLIGEINRGLAGLLRKDGFYNISDVRGKEGHLHI